MSAFNHTAVGIDWYCESTGSGPTVVLIPSGEGDCSSYEATKALLAENFSVLTFDTPGFSRSSAPENPDDLRLYTLGSQVVGLVRSLGIEKATFYGCSSGGRAALDILVSDAELVRNVIVHEAALPALMVPPLQAMMEESDAGVVATCKHLFGQLMNENQAAWLALGEEYHHRLERNYVTWVRRYLGFGMGEPLDPTLLKGQNIVWTVGGLTPPEVFANNFELAAAAGIEVGSLPCLHFPQVSIPDQLAAHITESTRPFLD